MIEQLGPFHIFFTLSAAEKRWHEVIIAILEKKGYAITELNDGLEPEDYLINGEPLEEFLEDLPESVNDLFNKNMMTITRMFDKRTRAFIKHVLMSHGGESGMKVKNYCFRIEFQARGMPHIHGVAWLEREH